MKTCKNCEMEKPIGEFRSNATKLKNRNQTVTLNCADCREELNEKNRKYKFSSSEEDSSSDDGSEDDSCVVDDDTISYEEASDSDEDEKSGSDDDEKEHDDDDDESEDYDQERNNKKRRRVMTIESEEEEEESSEELIPEIFKTKKWQFKSMRLSSVEFMELILEDPKLWIYNKKGKEAFYKKNQDYKIFYTQ